MGCPAGPDPGVCPLPASLGPGVELGCPGHVTPNQSVLGAVCPAMGTCCMGTCPSYLYMHHPNLELCGSPNDPGSPLGVEGDVSSTQPLWAGRVGAGQ